MLELISQVGNESKQINHRYLKWNFGALWLRDYLVASPAFLFPVKWIHPWQSGWLVKGSPQLSHFLSAGTGSAHSPENTVRADAVKLSWDNTSPFPLGVLIHVSDTSVWCLIGLGQRNVHCRHCAYSITAFPFPTPITGIRTSRHIYI